MYESYFGLSQRPFAAAPLVERFFPASSIDAARQALSRCIERAEGVGACIAAAGMGKTLLLEVLADQFSESFGTALLSAGAWATRRELLQAICFELKIPYQGLDEGELRLALVNQLTRTDKYRRGIVLLVDEAHTLSVPLLEELRVLSNLVHAGEPRVRLVIAGNLRLEELLAAPHLESFSQRLSCRTYLEPFDRAETTDYVRFQVAVAGGRVEQVFAPAAVDAVYRATDGVPRLVNQLCDHALLMAYSQEQRPVTTPCIEKAWADLQQLPVPWQEPPATSAATGNASSVVEFGALSDDLDDLQPQASIEFGGADAAYEPEPGAEDPIAQPPLGATRMEAAHEDLPPAKLIAEHQSHAADLPGDVESDGWEPGDEHDDAVRRAEARFEELAAQFEALQAEESTAEGNQYTEAELSFDDEDPFDEFDEEEPLIDPYAASAGAAWQVAESELQAVESTGKFDAAEPIESSWDEADQPLWDETFAEQADVEQSDIEQAIEEPVAEEPAADDEDEEPWEAVEEWSVQDSYRETGTSAMPEILSITPLPRPVAAEPTHEPSQAWAEACQDEPACEHEDIEASVLECPSETLAEVVIDPYAGLNELGERLRQEALQLTEASRPTDEPSEPAAHAESIELVHDIVFEVSLPGVADDVCEPVADSTELGEVNQTVEPVSPAGQPVDDIVVEEPVELRQGKLTLAEAIRRRKEASAAAPMRPVVSEAPAEPQQHEEPKAVAASPQHEEPWLSELTDEPISGEVTSQDEPGTPDEQVVIELDDTVESDPAAADETPRVRREDYRSLFERLRRS